MKTFYIAIEIVPMPANKNYERIKLAMAHCWIVTEDPLSAYARAGFYIAKYDFKINKVTRYPTEAIKEDFVGNDIGLEYFSKAQDYGFSIFVAAEAVDEAGCDEIEALKLSYDDFDLEAFLKKQKQLKTRGCCLHYEGDNMCKEIINAHSIQKNQSLSLIEKNGHVYMPQINLGSSNRFLVSYEKIGINKASTFLGFCKKHDNDLFEAIDKFPLQPTDKQVFLYAYRSLCREYFVRSNALDAPDSQLQNMLGNEAIIRLLTASRAGTSFSFDRLKQHKARYDTSLRGHSYSDIRYVLFVSTQQPSIAFSGLFYPDFDFMGRHLQNLGDHSAELRLITMCSAPTKTGWGFLFAWHKSSSDMCVDFMRSLATVAHGGLKLGDLLFRVVISNCENIAISPYWWEALSANHKGQIISRANSMADLLTIIQPNYLIEGLEGIVDWEFEDVVSQMD